MHLRLKKRGQRSCQKRLAVNRPKQTDTVSMSSETIPDPRAANQSAWSNMGGRASDGQEPPVTACWR
ncbi:MAG: hypothetical protein U0838_06600 [Chloroflexota bacterium]